MKMFMVGGAVRDELLGVRSKDIDFSVVLENSDIPDNQFMYDPFAFMVSKLEKQGFKIFLESPEFLTVRAQFPKQQGSKIPIVNLYGERNGLTADFVLARKEGQYTDGRRPDKVEVGTLEDDLARRDFTMNAIAKDADGNLIDPFNGQQDIEDRIIRAVGDPMERLTEDALRAVRAIRFAVTKDFNIEPSLRYALEYKFVTEAIANKISDERIQVELSKMFRFDTTASIVMLNRFPALTNAMFAGRVSLDATLKTKGRGK
jgi:tRNA nucleotidyltransferase/poly(A) polymerase